MADLTDSEDGIEWVLFCDADGSDDLSELPWLFAQAALGAELVLGNRRSLPANRQTMTPQQNFGNALATALIELGWNHRYHDLGPLRIIRSEALNRIAMRDRGFGWTVEMQVRAVEENLRIAEVPVRYRRRRGGRSKISGTIWGTVRAGSVILDTIGRLWVRRLLHRGRRACMSAIGVRLGQLTALALLLTGAAWILPHGSLDSSGALPPFLAGIGLMTFGYLAALQVGRFSAAMFWIVAVGLR